MNFFRLPHLLLLFSIFWFVNKPATAQEYLFNDSLEIILEEKLKNDEKGEETYVLLDAAIRYYLASDTKKVIKYNLKRQELAAKNDDISQLANADVVFGHIYKAQGLYQRAVELYSSAILLFQTAGDSGAVGWTYVEIGNIYYQLKLYENALSSYKKALVIFNRTKESHGIFVVHNNIGMIFRDQKKFNEALEHHESALDSAGGNLRRIDTARAYYYMAPIYVMSGNEEEAFPIIEKALNILSVLQHINPTSRDIKTAYANSLERKGEIYLHTDDLDKAYAVFEQCYNLYIKSANLFEAGRLLNLMGRIKYELGEYSAAESLINRALKISQENNLITIKAESYIILSNIYEAQGKYDKAYPAFRKYAELKDSIFNDDLRASIENAELKIETEHTAQKLELAEKEKMLDELSIDRQKGIITYQWIVIAAIILLVAALLYRYIYGKKVSKQIVAINERLKTAVAQLQKSEAELREINNNKDKFFSIVAHDLRSPFTLFLGLSDVFAEDIEKLSREEIILYSREMRDAAKNHFLYMENLLEWAKLQLGGYKFDKSNVSLNTKILKTIKLLEENVFAKNINILIELQDEHKVFADEYALESILYNLINNAIKFTELNGEIVISAERGSEGLIYTEVEDNGIGMPPEQINNLFRIDKAVSRVGTFNEKGSGIGLILIKELIEQQGGTISVQSEPNKGTKFRFSLPAG